MDEAFAQSLTDWAAFYALMGGAAATLLGLQFVAVSLRLNIFRQRDVADVRDFAAFAVGTFLVAIAIAALVLAPHEQPASLAVALLVIGFGGLIAMVWIIRAWVRLNQSAAENQPGYTPLQWQGWVLWVGTGAPYVGLLAVAILLWNEHLAALGWLAIVEGWLLATGTMAAWIILSHAGGDDAGAGVGD